MHRHTHTRAFTLIEMMIVVSILLILVAVVAVSFTNVFGKKNVTVAKATIAMLKSNINSYQVKWGGPPPGSLERLGLVIRLPELFDPNAQNRGIETMLLALRMGVKGGPYIDAELFAANDKRTNLDNDEADELALEDSRMAVRGAADLFELIDPWGNPYVYVNIGELRQGLFSETVTLANGNQVSIAMTTLQDKLRHPTTGMMPKGFVIWSFGEDGINDYGRGDDVTSWDKYDDDEDEEEEEEEEEEENPSSNQ